jgi:hypothetical protein
MGGLSNIVRPFAFTMLMTSGGNSRRVKGVFAVRLPVNQPGETKVEPMAPMGCWWNEQVGEVK